MYELGDSDRATVQPFLADLLVERGAEGEGAEFTQTSLLLWQMWQDQNRQMQKGKTPQTIYSQRSCGGQVWL